MLVVGPWLSLNFAKAIWGSPIFEFSADMTEAMVSHNERGEII
jgi:hypothetical protein